MSRTYRREEREVLKRQRREDQENRDHAALIEDSHTYRRVPTHVTLRRVEVPE